MKIRYRDLSAPLKWAIWFAWILGSIGIIQFIIGFYLGYTGA